jgi:hypothetical protein
VNVYRGRGRTDGGGGKGGQEGLREGGTEEGGTELQLEEI